MTIINLRDFYYWYTQDEYMEVSDEVAEALRSQRHRTDEKIFEKKSAIAVSICSIFLVVYERKFFLLHN